MSLKMQSTPGPKLNISQRRKARSLLVQALYQWQLSDTPASEIEAQFRADNEGKIDWDFFHEVLAAVPEQQKSLDALFESFLDRQIKDLNPVELALLRMGAFELSQRVDVPYRVVINECVDLAKKFGATDSHKYINGVLDKTARHLRTPELNANT
ncbi:MAG: transcription antitermination factor NusB [Pseudohongiellaceae bacterium]